MSRILLLGMLIFALLIGALASFHPVWIELAIPLAVYLLAGFIFAPGKLNLAVERLVSAERVAPGQPVEVALRITNHGDPIRQLQLIDILPENGILISGSTRRMAALAQGETLVWKYTFSGKRGFYTFPDLVASASDPFGLFTERQVLPANGQIMILPEAARVRRLVIRTRATRVYSGSIPARLGGPGVDFFGVREYEPGDPQHAINWRLSARHPQALFANEFEQERVADVGLVLDARRRSNQMGQNLSIFDESILATASLSETFLGAGNRVGLLIYGQFINWTLPGYGKRQRERILQSLARAVPGDSQAFAGIYIPRSLFPVNSQIVFISPLVDDDIEPLVSLRAQGYALIVVSPNAIQYEAAHLPVSAAVQQAAQILSLKRGITLRRLRHAGVQVVDWDISQPFEQVVEAALSRPPAFIRAIGAGALTAPVNR